MVKADIACEPVAAIPMTSYADAMMMIHTMHLSREDKKRVAHRLTVEVTAPHLSKAFDRIEHLSTLQKDWAGEGSLPISRRVLNNVRQVLLISDDRDWEKWFIAPDVNATLTLQSKTSDGTISMGADEYSYYAEKGGEKYRASHVPFTPETFLQTMHTIE